MSIEEIEKEISALKEDRERLCNESTKEISSKIEHLSEELRGAQVKKSLGVAPEYIELSKIVGEMARKVLIINFALGVDEAFKITPHVSWLEWGGRDMISYSLGVANYSDKKNDRVFFSEIKELSDEIEEKYQEALSKLKELGVSDAH